MDYKKIIWDYFMAYFGNAYGVAALMGNLQAESNLNPKNLENRTESELGYSDDTYTLSVDTKVYSMSQFVYDNAGYGLAQWTHPSRKQALYELWESGDYDSISDINLQMGYLLKELINDYWNVHQAILNATSIRSASDVVLHQFENPADQSTSVEEKRENMGIAIYMEMTGGGYQPDEPDEPETKRKKRGYKFLLFDRKRRYYG